MVPNAQPVDDHIVVTRVELTPITPADATDMVGVLSGTELYTFIGGTAPSLEELRAQYTRLAVGHSADGRQDWYNWVIRSRLDGQAVGTVQATVVDEGEHAEIAWIVGLRWQRQGYATEAARALVDWLDARKGPYITAHVHPGHQASIKVASRIGLLPTNHFDDGERLWQRGDHPSHPSR
ncbi:MAG: GNAT family N-acetyltransferase [Pseudonocardiaceae bacterium]